MSAPCLLTQGGGVTSKGASAGYILAVRRKRPVTANLVSCPFLASLPSSVHNSGPCCALTSVQRHVSKRRILGRMAVPCGRSSLVETDGNLGGASVGSLEALHLGSSWLRELDGLLVFEEGRSAELLRAAAYLRALSFYNYPEGRSEEGLKLHRKMKAEDEWTALTSKVAGLEQGYKRVACLLALCPVSHLVNINLVLHPFCKVVLPNGEEHSLVGTLDVNQGLQLPGEITGDYPKGLDAEQQRGYLSNVCVAPEIRNRGVGAALLLQAQKIMQLWGVSDLYVHVVSDNVAAVKLYHKAGFVYEKEETASEARLMSRPRRLLLHKHLPAPDFV